MIMRPQPARPTTGKKQLTTKEKKEAELAKIQKEAAVRERRAVEAFMEADVDGSETLDPDELAKLIVTLLNEHSSGRDAGNLLAKDELPPALISALQELQPSISEERLFAAISLVTPSDEELQAEAPSAAKRSRSPSPEPAAKADQATGPNTVAAPNPPSTKRVSPRKRHSPFKP